MYFWRHRNSSLAIRTIYYSDKFLGFKKKVKNKTSVTFLLSFFFFNFILFKDNDIKHHPSLQLIKLQYRALFVLHHNWDTFYLLTPLWFLKIYLITHPHFKFYFFSILNMSGVSGKNKSEILAMTHDPPSLVLRDLNNNAPIFRLLFCVFELEVPYSIGAVRWIAKHSPRFFCLFFC